MWLSRDEYTGNNICKIWHNKPSLIDGSYYLEPEESGRADEAEFWNSGKGKNYGHQRYIRGSAGAIIDLRPDLELKRGNLLELNSEIK